MAREIKIAAAVLALIRGELAASCIADTFGATEAQVQRWKDIFQVAGIVALTNALRSGEPDAEDEPWGEPTTPRPREPTTTPRRPRPTTRPPKMTKASKKRNPRHT